MEQRSSAVSLTCCVNRRRNASRHMRDHTALLRAVHERIEFIQISLTSLAGAAGQVPSVSGTRTASHTAKYHTPIDRVPTDRTARDRTPTDHTLVDRTTLVKENLALISLGEGMVEHIRSVAAISLADTDSSATIKAKSENGDLDDVADDRSICPPTNEGVCVLIDDWRRNAMIGQNTTEAQPTDDFYAPWKPDGKRHQPVIPQRVDDIVDRPPSAFERRVFDGQFAKAKASFEDKDYAASLMRLKHLLPKVSKFAAMDDKTGNPVWNLTASVLLALQISVPDEDQILATYPPVSIEYVNLASAEARAFMDRKDKTGHEQALARLTNIHNMPNVCPEAGIVISKSTSRLFAQSLHNCKMYSKLSDEITTAIAARYPTVECRLFKLRVDDLDHGLHLRLSEKEEYIRFLIKTFERFKTGTVDQKALCTADREFELSVYLARELIKDRHISWDGPKTQEGLAILTRMHQDALLETDQKFGVTLLLGNAYMSRVEYWEQARQLAVNSHAILVEECPEILDDPEGPLPSCLELLARTSELLGDPEAEEWADILALDFKDHERELMQTDEAFALFFAYLGRKFANDLPGARNAAVEFLRRHYKDDVLDAFGEQRKPCWECMKLSMTSTGNLFLGRAEFPCPVKKCPSASRLPVLEFLAATEPKIRVDDKTDWDCSEEIELLIENAQNAEPEKAQRRSILSGLEWEKLQRIAIVNGRPGIVRELSSIDEDLITSKVFGNQEPFERIVPGMAYLSMTSAVRNQRTSGQVQAISKLVDELSTDDIHRVLRRVFLPGSIWDTEIIGILISELLRCANFRSEAARREALLSTPILRQVVRNLASAPDCKTKDIKLVCDVLDIFIKHQSPEIYQALPEETTVKSVAIWVGAQQPRIKAVADAVAAKFPEAPADIRFAFEIPSRPNKIICIKKGSSGHKRLPEISSEE